MAYWFASITFALDLWKLHHHHNHCTITSNIIIITIITIISTISHSIIAQLALFAFTETVWAVGGGRCKPVYNMSFEISTYNHFFALIPPAIQPTTGPIPMHIHCGEVRLCDDPLLRPRSYAIILISIDVHRLDATPKTTCRGPSPVPPPSSHAFTLGLETIIMHCH